MFTLKYALNYIEIKNHNLGSLIPTIVAFIIHIQPLSSPLLLRISPHTFAFIPIPPMSFSSRNRSIFNTFRHIQPCVAPVCEGIHYHKTEVPWQMNKTLIIIFSCSEMPYNAEFCVGLSAFPGIVFSLLMTTLFAKYFKMVQFNAMCSSQIVVS